MKFGTSGMYAPIINNLFVGFTYMTDDTILKFIHDDDFSRFQNTELEFHLHYDESKKPNLLDFLYLTNWEQPNVIIILTESFSNLYLQTKKALKNAPFFSETVLKNKDFYWFSKGRATSGMTDTATPAIILGSAIAADANDIATKTYFQLPNIIKILKQLNYTTVLYCAYDTDFHGHRWGHMTELFAQFDLNISRSTLGEEAINEYGMDDRKLTNILEKDLRENYGDKSFFITIIWNNLHYPFLTDESYVANTSTTKQKQQQARYINSIGITDNMTHQIFDTLDDLQIRHKTIVAFSSDHGETPGDVFRRETWLQSEVLHVPLWFHVSQNYSLGRNLDTFSLRSNSNKLVSNLDIFPTLVDALQLQVNFNSSKKSHYLIGKSLFKPISKRRIIIGWQGMPFVNDCPPSTAYLANETHIIFFRARWNRSQMEILNEDLSVRMEIEWGNIPEVEKNKWSKILLVEYPSVYYQLTKCGFHLF